MEEEPELLLELRGAWNGVVPRTAGDRQAAAWLMDDPKGFRHKFTQLQSEWSSRSRPGGLQTNMQTVEEDHQTGQIVETIMRLLKQAGER
jgi:hypothetical protein